MLRAKDAPGNGAQKLQFCLVSLVVRLLAPAKCSQPLGYGAILTRVAAQAGSTGAPTALAMSPTTSRVRRTMARVFVLSAPVHSAASLGIVKQSCLSCMNLGSRMWGQNMGSKRYEIDRVRTGCLVHTPVQ